VIINEHDDDEDDDEQYTNTIYERLNNHTRKTNCTQMASLLHRKHSNKAHGWLSLLFWISGFVAAEKTQVLYE